MTIRFHGEWLYIVNALHHTTHCRVNWPSWPCWDAECHLPACPPPSWRRLNSTISSDSGGRQCVHNQFTSVRPHLHTKQHCCFPPNLSKLLFGSKGHVKYFQLKNAPINRHVSERDEILFFMEKWKKKVRIIKYIWQTMFRLLLRSKILGELYPYHSSKLDGTPKKHHFFFSNMIPSTLCLVKVN